MPINKGEDEMEAKERLIVALDVDTKEEAETLIELLKEDVGMFKIGLQLYTSAGNEIVRFIKSKGCKVFLDLKLHDIPNTVAESARVLTQLGVDMMNVHAQGGYEMMKRAKEATVEESKRLRIDPPKLIAVTILTSLGEEEVKSIGYEKSPKGMVELLGKLTKEAGLDGVVCSPLEASIIRDACGPDFASVTPGVRPSGGDIGDQKRVTTPKMALEGGATYIVVGRPITKAEDVAAAAKAIVKEMEEASC